ncbi:MAG: hypothetical protein OHK0017_07770 [Patescibacteria group bacterium]
MPKKNTLEPEAVEQAVPIQEVEQEAVELKTYCFPDHNFVCEAVDQEDADKQFQDFINNKSN